MKSKGIGLLIFPEDMLKIQRCVKPQFQFAVILALSRYAETGEEPSEEEIGEAGMVAFEFIRDKVDESVTSFKKKREATQNAANSRWKNTDNENECNRMQTDANACNSTIAVAGTVSETVSVTDKKEEGGKTEDAPTTSANLIFDLTPEEMRKNAEVDERVARLIKQCLSPWSDIKQMRVLEDVGKYGIDKVEAALIKSAEKTKGANSLPFYRTFLTGDGKSKPEAKTAEGNYQHRHYTEEDFKGMEADLDSLEEDTR